MHQIVSFPIFCSAHFSISFPSISNFIILHSFHVFYLHSGSFLAKPLPLKPLLSITINHLAFKDKRRVLNPPSDTRSSCWCLGGSFKDVSSATLPAAELSQWRFVVVLSVCQRRGVLLYESVSLDPQVTSSCSSPTRELTPAEWILNHSWFIFIAHF